MAMFSAKLVLKRSSENICGSLWPRLRWWSAAWPTSVKLSQQHPACTATASYLRPVDGSSGLLSQDVKHSQPAVVPASTPGCLQAHGSSSVRTDKPQKSDMQHHTPQAGPPSFPRHPPHIRLNSHHTMSPTSSSNWAHTWRSHLPLATPPAASHQALSFRHLSSHASMGGSSGSISDDEEVGLVVAEKERDSVFEDSARLEAHGGAGGAGCVSFVRVQTGRKLVANGGNGGWGGDVVLRATSGHNGLSGLPPVVKAGQGLRGSSNAKAGRGGADKVVMVPAGTVVHVLEEFDPQYSSTGSTHDVTHHMGGTPSAGRTQSRQFGPQAVGTGGRGGEMSEEGKEKEEEWDEEEEEEWEDEQEAGGDGGEDEDFVPKPKHAWDWERLRVRHSFELLREGDEVVVARGGQGGTGNNGERVRSATRAQAVAAFGARPQGAGRAHANANDSAGGGEGGGDGLGRPGEGGEVVRLLLELRLLADVGLVGMPNVGKSSLLRALTASRAQVGDYAFTTLRPQLGALPTSATSHHHHHHHSHHSQSQGDGVWRTHASGSAAGPGGSASGGKGRGKEGNAELAKPLVVADIPGLVDGAHANRGRGNAFLRHVSRCSAVVVVVDGEGGQPGALNPLTPVEQLQVVMAELAAYNATTHALGATSTQAAAGTHQQQQGGSGAHHQPGHQHSQHNHQKEKVEEVEGEEGDAGEGEPRTPRTAQDLLPRAQLPHPALVVVNKIDACSNPREVLGQLKAAVTLPILPVSAKQGQGLVRLADALRLVAGVAGAGAAKAA